MDKKPEILAPAGNLAAGIYAIKAGADEIYTGLPRFSARAFADNPATQELAALKAFAKEHGVRLNIALNTLIRDSEIKEACYWLEIISMLNADAVIVQDIGIADIVRRDFPDLKLHASTQMAIHNTDGARIMRELGFTRVILARELELGEIEQIIREVPELEYEVFVSGAMCYSTSGVCLASGLMLNRSANRGVCAQVCRTWQKNGEKKQYTFSMKDLMLIEHAEELAQAGVSTFKIEGRMKSPEYVDAAVRLWRTRLDKGITDREAAEKLALSFMRSTSSGHIRKHDADSLTDTEYPGHRGIKAGTVIKSEENRALIKTSHKLSIRDGLGVIRDGELLAWPIKLITKKQRRLTVAEKGSTVWINTQIKLRENEELRLISAHNNKLPEIKLSSLNKEALSVKASIRTAPDRLHINLSYAKNSIEMTFHQPALIAKEPGKTAEMLKKLFSYYHPRDRLPISANITLTAEKGMEVDKIFYPLSFLKQARREVFEELYNRLDKKITTCPRHSKKAPFSPASLPARKQLSPPGSRLPFITDYTALKKEKLSRIILDGTQYLALPLAPTAFSDQPGYSKLEKAISALGDTHLLIGLNNPAHILWAKKLAERFPGRLAFFTDYLLYNANSFAEQVYRDKIPNLIFSFPWIESPAKHDCYRDFYPPVFYSRVIHSTDSPLLQNKIRLSIIRQNNMSYTIAENI